jgi:hypothetical protein
LHCERRVDLEAVKGHLLWRLTNKITGSRRLSGLIAGLGAVQEPRKTTLHYSTPKGTSKNPCIAKLHS